MQPVVVGGETSSVGDSLASLLREHRVPWETLESRYGSLLKLVEILLGVVPNCDPYLEIWPPGFRTYNIMVPELPQPAGADLRRRRSARRAAKPPPPADGWPTKLRVLPLVPSALRLDAGWQKGVPKAWPAIGEFLRGRTGHDFPVLSRLHGARAARAVASMLRENLDPASTVIGLDTKVLAGVVFADIVADHALATDVRALAERHGVTRAQIDHAVRFARGGDDALFPDADERLRAALLLSRAGSPSPPRIDAEVVAACRDAGLSPPAIVELVCWLSVLQMLHRLSCFYAGR
jgi:hypothetical protein